MRKCSREAREWLDLALLLSFLAVGIVVGICARRAPGPGQHCGCAAINCTEPCSSCCSPDSCRGMQGYGLQDLVEDEPGDPVVRPR